MAPVFDSDQLQLVARVARLYHSTGLRQTDIAKRFGVSQARVSRLLLMADQSGIVKTVVRPPLGLFPELESQLEEHFGLLQVHIVDSVPDQPEPREALGRTVATAVESIPLEDKVVGFTAWSRALRTTANLLPRSGRMTTGTVVELLGDVGPPTMQHKSALATEQFANAIGSTPVFLRLPSVAPSADIAESLRNNDSHARRALELMDSLDVALVGIGSCNLASPTYTGASFFTEEQLAVPIAAGAVGQINLRFLNSAGARVKTPLDDAVIGVTLDQIKRARIRIGVAAGLEKAPVILASILGGWVNILVTDRWTATMLLK
jgi:DNA-binding transcriptional regulator LsrR (DeoR family)